MIPAPLLRLAMPPKRDRGGAASEAASADDAAGIVERSSNEGLGLAPPLLPPLPSPLGGCEK
jgi:hypothetical protein